MKRGAKCYTTAAISSRVVSTLQPLRKATRSAKKEYFKQCKKGCTTAFRFLVIKGNVCGYSHTADYPVDKIKTRCEPHKRQCIARRTCILVSACLVKNNGTKQEAPYDCWQAGQERAHLASTSLWKHVPKDLEPHDLVSNYCGIG